jgi:hypothetical protein
MKQALLAVVVDPVDRIPISTGDKFNGIKVGSKNAKLSQFHCEVSIVWCNTNAMR